MINVATEISQNKMSARDLVIARLQEKEQGLNNNILQKEAAIQQFGLSWPLYVKEDKQTEIEVLKDQLANVKGKWQPKFLLCHLQETLKIIYRSLLHNFYICFTLGVIVT